MTYSDETKTFRCSARVVKELNLYDIITNMSDMLEGFGGHKLAAGFSFSSEKLSFEEVKKSINKTVNEMLNGKKLQPSLDIDLELNIEDVDIALVEEISKLEPFGMSNPSPTFVVNNLTLKQKKLMGATKEHLKLMIEGPSGLIDCVWWSRGDVPLVPGDRLDIAFEPQLNVFNGVTSVQCIIKDVHSEGLNNEEESKQKVYDNRKKTNILPLVNDYINTSKYDICVFAEDKSIIESLKPYKKICNSIADRNSLHKSDVLMFFDYPADEEVLQNVMNTVLPSAIHYMNYQADKYNETELIKQFFGMIKYACNNLNGEFNIKRAAAALSLSSIAIETLLEVFEDAGMIKIKERASEAFYIDFISAVEVSKVLQTPKFAEFAEIMNTIFEYKNKFMTAELS